MNFSSTLRMAKVTSINCLALLFWIFCTQTIYSQMYVTADPPEFYFYDLSNNTFTQLANTPVNFGSAINLSEIMTYTVTLTNAGSVVAPDGKVRVSIPENSIFLTSVPNQDIYDSASQIWDLVSSLAVMRNMPNSNLLISNSSEELTIFSKSH